MATLGFSATDFLAAFHLIQSAIDALEPKSQEHGSVIAELQGYKKLLQFVQDLNVDVNDNDGVSEEQEESRAVVVQLQAAVMQNQQVIRNLWRQHQRNQGVVVDGAGDARLGAFQQSCDGFAQDPLEILEAVIAGENRNLRLLIASKLGVIAAAPTLAFNTSGNSIVLPGYLQAVKRCYNFVFNLPGCTLIILIFTSFLILSISLGVYFTIQSRWYKYSMGDSFTLASYVFGVGAVLSAIISTYHFPRCKCWAGSSSSIGLQELGHG